MEIIIKCFVALIWSVVGLIVWIPISIRVMLVHIFNVSKITIMEEDLPKEKYLNLLVETGSLYINGFKNIFRKGDDGIIEKPKKERNQNLWLDVLWALLFWGSIILPFVVNRLM